MAVPEPEAGLWPLRIAKKWRETPEIWLFELRHPDGGELPPFTAGAHVTVETPAGPRREYSLCNDPGERERYVLGVKAEAGGRGGSLSMANDTREGDLLPVSAPSNRFPLVAAPAYLFIAGGIGITPIMSMVRLLARGGKTPFRLVYCTREPELTAFREDLGAPALAGRVTVYHDGGDPERAFDFWPLLEKPGAAHVYCCGPAGLMEEVRGMTGHWPAGAVHFEDFGSDAVVAKAEDKPFRVRHARTGETVEVAPGTTILEALRARGHRMPSSCEHGVCGTCRTRLVAGTADHRDRVLTAAERERFIQICISRALSPELVLDW